MADPYHRPPTANDNPPPLPDPASRPDAVGMAARRPGAELPSPPKWWGPMPKLEGPVASVVRFVWNIAISCVIAGIVALFAHAVAVEVVERFFGPPGPGLLRGLSLGGWALGLGLAAVLALSYYLDDDAA
ncbi:MAG: hypothetical protein IPK81_07990 [Rhodospirillales bacterium]|nr:hypothetical protein [Rhodospirillales bacterium]QQS14109.1 MAG: hypothetical protein IPK81_07990 [Rhodospirillales bacterium]